MHQKGIQKSFLFFRLFMGPESYTFQMEFTLPPLTQESFSRWFNKKVPRNDDIEERIVYPGVKLECSSKSRDLRSNIKPCNVFITRIGETNEYHHKVLGSNNIFIPLSKRLYSHCFRNINIHSIPNDNRIVVRLTENTSVTLPYIPDDFVTQKRSKRHASGRSRNKRDVKRSKHKANEVLAPYTGWITRVMTRATDFGADNAISSFELMKYIRDEARKNDNSMTSCIPNPFAGATSISAIQACPDKQRALTTIIQFVHHYARHYV